MTSSDRFRDWRRVGVALLVSMMPLGFGPTSALAQPSTRCANVRRVRGIAFAGSPLFDDVTLLASIATQAPTFVARTLHLKSLPCSDSLSVRLDALRIAVLHRQAGWLQAVVSVTSDTSARGVRLRFEIMPGTPTIIDTVRLNGLPVSETVRRSVEGPLRALQGQRFDRVRVDTTISAVVARLRDAGFARATRPVLAMVTDTAAAKVHLTVKFAIGLPMTVRAVTVDVQGFGDAAPNIDTVDVRRLTALRPGRRYSAADVLGAQRDLYRSDAFRLVLIDTMTAPAASLAGTSADTVIDLHITVAQARTRNARLGAGWATLECLRTQARFVDRRFLGVGRRLELTARASRIGVGRPADFAPGICSPALRADTQFTVLNYYLGASVSSTRLFGSPLSPVTSIYTERRSEPYAYVREIGIGALIELSKSFSPRTVGTGGVQYENGRTKIDPAESCSRFGQCRQEEYEQSLFGRGVGIVSGSLTHDRTNNSIDPVRGFRTRTELRAGQTFSTMNSSVRFYRTSGEAAAYRRVLGGVFATRLQVARAFAPGAALVDGSPLIPQQERLFAGGQNTVRGFQQNQLGALVYVISDVENTTNGGVPVVQAKANADYDRAVPRGGTALTVANLEYRHPFRWLSSQLQMVGFVDIGNVWEGGSEPFRVANLRATPGMGMRIVTSLGPFRIDVGYQPYAPRAGRALFLSKAASGVSGSIQCASPGNTVSIDAANPGSIFDCPETYRPSRGRGVLSRLAFHFGLGQAF